ncbi:InlB B-repeat-containing protein [Geminisphaera colitermitum]|uniref:InlB B-repeat-containing protein n=1 Tax=Geminisphaera colitermitum TaxID=1148786 RepID=UPI000158D5E9|nr:InlB B-repeat-containing protein [Geminisphaera colitermitum]
MNIKRKKTGTTLLMTFVLAGFSPGLSAAEYNYSGNSPVITKSVSGSENLKITYSNGTLTGTANGIGATSVSGDIEVANGGIINVSGPNGIYAYSSSGGDVYLENTGSITTSGTYGVGLTATKTGNIEVLNADGASIAGKGHGIYAATVAGDIKITNFGSARTTSGDYGIYVYTAGKIDITNYGDVSSSNYYGIYVCSNITGGTIRNYGSVSALGGDPYTLDILGKNTTVELFNGAAAPITGSIYMAGGNNTLVAHGQQTVTNGWVKIHFNTTYRPVIRTADDYGAIISNKYMEIEPSAAMLDVDVSDANIKAGDSFRILAASSYISQQFKNAKNNSILIVNGNGGVYKFLVTYNGKEVWLTATEAPVIVTPPPAPTSVTVTFDPDGGSPVSSQTVDYGATATEPAAPTKTGYTFAGWYDGASAWSFGTPVTGALTLTAHWTAVPEPTIPAKIDDDSVVVIPDPSTPGGIVIEGDIDADPNDPDQTQVFDLDKLRVVTTTDLTLTTEWPVAVEGTHYTVTLNEDQTRFTLIINPLSGSDTARFYRVVTSTKVFNANGTPATDSSTIYNTIISGQYKITILPGEVKLVANQLISADDTVNGLFGSLPGRSSVDVIDIDINSATYGETLSSTRRNSGAGWSSGGDYALPVGYAAYVTNGSASLAATINFGGVVSQTPQTYALSAGINWQIGSAVPVAVTNPVDIGYVMSRRDAFNKLDVNGEDDSYSITNAGTAWTGGRIPSFDIGEGYYYTPYSDAIWQQPPLTVEENTSIVH